MAKFLNFDTTLFIKEVQKRPAIWDTSVEHGKDMKKKAWDEINNVFGVKNMSQADKHLLAWRLQQRWKNLRTCFAREIKRQKNYGAGTGRRSEYIYYKNLLFLTNVMNLTEKETSEPELNTEYVYVEDNNASLTTVNECQTDVSQDTDDETLAQKRRPKRKTYDYEEPFSEEDEDEDHLFLLSLHKTLKKVPRNKKMAVKIRMLTILNETLTEIL
ncbi:transcription factor Adf-1-like [Pararge aegeria]|uniref:Jg1511 protein n=1 Tax=Pararge aegeria aegeria TaxID=348720 RepID=A0A8S4S503_9NEOP|nr:transcription factor Adf-1-like [Pararge aegeria]CAH2244447.1 jg1511 [Pararge aegeria aegeria]